MKLLLDEESFDVAVEIRSFAALNMADLDFPPPLQKQLYPRPLEQLRIPEDRDPINYRKEMSFIIYRIIKFYQYHSAWSYI